MKTNFHIMYDKKKNDIRFVLIVSVVCLALFFTLYPINKYLFTDPINIAITENYEENDENVILVMVFLFVYYLPYSIYALLTVKNIDFKLYMCYIFLGNQMIDKIGGSSIFLVGKPSITYEEIPGFDDSIESLQFDISFPRRMIHTDQEDFTDDENDDRKRLSYEVNIGKSQSFNQ